MKTLCISENAIEAITALNAPDEWYDSFVVDGEVVSVDVAGNVFLLTEKCNEKTEFVVFNIENEGFFKGIEESLRGYVLDRCLRLARNTLDQNIKLPPDYACFHSDNKISIFSTNYSQKRGDRIIAQIHPSRWCAIYIYSISADSDALDLTNYEIDQTKLLDAHAAFITALTHRSNPVTQTRDGIYLEKVFENDNLTRGLTYANWYPDQLTNDQLKFVDTPMLKPIRLRGAAGTGKTISMVIKALKTIYDAEDDERPCKILYVTHSWATVDHLERLFRTIDIRDTFRPRNDGISIDIFPLVFLADQMVDLNRKTRILAGSDSLSGKLEQLKRIEECILLFRRSDWITLSASCGEAFRERVNSPENSSTQRLFAWDLMNEFSSVFAADGILPRHKEQYFRIKRTKWMMPLDNEAEKECVLNIYRRYLEILSERGETSTDQIISDFINVLTTFQWENSRKTSGYDAVFVDEMQLFDAQERLSFHHLLKDPEESPKVAMAIDPKQSPVEFFVDISPDEASTDTGIYARARLRDPELIDLVTAFRYTPQINKLIKAILDIVPAMDLGEEWEVPKASSDHEDGPVPEAKEFPDRLATFKYICSRARELSRVSKFSTAILCLDHQRFAEYARAAKGQFDKDVFIIQSRSDTEHLRYIGRKYVLSMPEFVGGLQFEAVIIADLSDDLVRKGRNNSYSIRRFISELYLGISRAEKILELCATSRDGGLNQLMQRCAGAYIPPSKGTKLR